MAAHVREYIGVPLDVQVSWQDDDAALKQWRQALQSVGVFVFKDAFRVADYSGFCLHDETFPIIYVNNSAARTRQIFTLFHELAHLLFHTSGVDTETDSFIPSLSAAGRRIEILCNQFAAEFLLPDEVLDQAIAGQSTNRQTAEILAARFHVSRESVFRRFLDRQLVEQAAYEAAAAEWSSQQRGGNGGDYYWNQISYLGRDYIGIAFRRFQQNRIDERQLAEYLDMKPRNIAALEEYFARSST